MEPESRRETTLLKRPAPANRAQPHHLPLKMSALALTGLLTACGGGGYGGNDNNQAGNEDEIAIPSRSTTIALTSDDQRIVVVNRQNDSVSVLQVKGTNGNDTQTKLGEVTVGKEPRYVALTPDDQTAYVTNAVDGTVSMIDLSGSTPTLSGDPIIVGTEPRGIALTPNGKYAYVANHTEGSVSLIRTSTNTVINTIPVGGKPMSISITNDGDDDDRDETVYITRFFSEVIDPENRPDGFNDAKQGVIDYFNVNDSIDTLPTVAQFFVAPINDTGFPADRRQFCQETRNILQDNDEVIFFNSGVLADGDGAAALASDIFCPDNTSTDASAEGVIAKTTQGAYPNQLFSSILRKGGLFLPNVGASPEPPVKFNVNIQALVTTLDTRSGNQITTNINNQIKAETQPENETESLDRLFGNELVAIDASPSGDQFLLVSRGGNYVMRATVANDGTLDIGAPSGVVRFQTGNIPTGVAMSQDGTRAYTNNEVSTSVTAIDLENNSVLERDIDSSTPPVPGTQKHRNVVGKLAFFSALGIPDTLDTDGDDNFDIEVRDIEPLAFRGKSSDNAWSSCASCHDDGHSDNVTWIFPTGPRQTIALEGTFSKTDPSDQRILNWNAVRGSVTDFNNNSRGVQGGIGHATNVDGENKTAQVFNHGPTQGISDALDAMTEWVANSVRAPIMPAGNATDVTAGRELFDQGSCRVCHGGDKWTKSTILFYQNNPTFAGNPLAANFFAVGKEPALDENLSTGGPQIVSVELNQFSTLKFLDDIGTRDPANPLEIRGAGAIGGGTISIAGDPNEGLEVARQSTQGFASLGSAGFNTPSLLGVGYHAPYFHDGSAETLREVFEKHVLVVQDGQSFSIAEALQGAIDEGLIEGELEALLSQLEAFLLSIDDETESFTFGVLE